ncbi:hypothetical protein Fbal_2820 [Ferrimonas balearica DSM 9799]|uniref:Uncharacterized protein n=1 Tax=Ferrimonas balearica (strain DSM 9799 / CCM 4581 / KCTC 23876 / PAT) TaxID=550540 RepID=E1SS90_FERBD|nr:hypothetical protein [Ferrimonas balearica]MBY6017517.1 hypothetical protein [Halomonas denitrificans]ADN77022.1 hypothetical protein Fbal_2820 [Ferrimonas balearica DSM 9799]MBW3139984.1 hypothetical protein [Ferrimonas balearica]MBW3165008.1 hypothetical protein [Ferrimonas balearica]MBY5980125.1 hypothetical protein [Ferrimonas balearica]
MTTIALLAALITTPALQPEPVQFDREGINQEVQAQLQVQLDEVHQSLMSMDAQPALKLARTEPQQDSKDGE